MKLEHPCIPRVSPRGIQIRGNPTFLQTAKNSPPASSSVLQSHLITLATRSHLTPHHNKVTQHPPRRHKSPTWPPTLSVFSARLKIISKRAHFAAINARENTSQRSFTRRQNCDNISSRVALQRESLKILSLQLQIFSFFCTLHRQITAFTHFQVLFFTVT